ncbi:hypothetical protein K438DRAFT_2028277 [Mycena galopus ATCC 62051]|nr:hypothetical protein K438DRAFT_2028277 [Mycena galopus ATCC 62051]
MTSPMDLPQSYAVPFPFIVLSGYLGVIPLVNVLSAPTGFGGRVLTPLLSSALQRVSNGASSIEGSPQKALALLTLFYVFVVFILSAIMSAQAQMLGNKTGYKNGEPRMTKRSITSGLPHRMIATHEALYDIFPAYAVAAAALFASTSTAPSTLSTSTVTALNALVLHVFFKLFVYAPAYLLNIDPIRTFSHMCSMAAVLLAIWSVVVD